MITVEAIYGTLLRSTGYIVLHIEGSLDAADISVGCSAASTGILLSPEFCVSIKKAVFLVAWDLWAFSPHFLGGFLPNLISRSAIGIPLPIPSGEITHLETIHTKKRQGR